LGLHHLFLSADSTVIAWFDGLNNDEGFYLYHVLNIGSKGKRSLIWAALNQETGRRKEYLPTLNQYLPTLNQYLPTLNQYLPTLNQYLPTLNQYLPTHFSRSRTQNQI
jgi:hypothetical protein